MNKVLLLDIETSPNVGYTWGKYDQNVIAFKKEWELLSVAWKWLDGPKTAVVTRMDFKDSSDKSLTKALHALLDEADIVVAHNGQQFDVRKSRAKFLEHGLKPPKPFKVIDTVLVARSKFNLNSNKLDDLGRLLGVGRKKQLKEGIELWLKCMAGDAKAFADMASYNKQDVDLLERVYLKLRPWMGPSGDIVAGQGCTKCGSAKLQSRGHIITATSKFRRFQCQGCGAWSKERVAESRLPKTNKAGL